MLSAFFALSALHTRAADAATYRIDPKSTSASFEVWMLGFIPIRGHFNYTSGTLGFDPANRNGQISVRIETGGLETNSMRARSAARGPQFFDVERYPRIDFKSSRFVFDGDRLRSIEGLLTLTGTTQPVTLDVTESTCTVASESEPPRCHATAALTVMRSKFGMRAWSRSLADEVTIRIAIVAFAEAADAAALVAPASTPIEAPELQKTPQ
jgi:polyisoprenoid-binding protein YceI